MCEAGTCRYLILRGANGAREGHPRVSHRAREQDGPDIVLGVETGLLSVECFPRCSSWERKTGW